MLGTITCSGPGAVISPMPTALAKSRQPNTFQPKAVLSSSNALVNPELLKQPKKIIGRKLTCGLPLKDWFEKRSSYFKWFIQGQRAAGPLDCLAVRD
jgi:hypothetical protein